LILRGAKSKSNGTGGSTQKSIKPSDVEISKQPLFERLKSPFYSQRKWLKSLSEFQNPTELWKIISDLPEPIIGTQKSG
jgi:hypothetical protein